MARIGDARRWAWRAKLVAAALLALLGLDVPLLGARTAPLALLLLTAGTGWLLALLARPAPGEAAAPLRRKQIALAVGTSVVMLVLVLLVGVTVRGRSPAAEARAPWHEGARAAPQMSDPELGWSPYGPPDVIGQRLERVDPTRPHVLLMGDSIVFGYGVGADQHVGRELERRVPGYQVLNGAVSGYSIDQYLLLLRRYVPVVRPRLIIVGVFTGNDFQISAREFGWGNSKPMLRLERGELVRADVASACIGRLTRSILFRQLWRSRELASASIEALCRPAHLARGEAERTIAAIFDAIDELARANGARVLYALLPVDSELEPYDTDRFLYVSRHPDLWRLLGERPRERWDFAGDLFAHGADPRPLFQGDHAHLLPEGHRRLAAALAREIHARGLLGP